jgi:hypothetical protein
MGKIEELGKMILCKYHTVYHKSHMDCPDNETGLLEFAKIVCLLLEWKHENGRKQFLHNGILLHTELFSFVRTVYY